MCRRFGTTVASSDRIIYKAMIAKIRWNKDPRKLEILGILNFGWERLLATSRSSSAKWLSVLKSGRIWCPSSLQLIIIPHHDLNPRHKATWFNVYSDLFALFSQTLFGILYSSLLEWEYWLCIWSIWSLWLWPHRRLWTFQQCWVIRTLKMHLIS